MRIFAKHIFRSIKANPRQPVMITLIVCICVVVMMLSVALPLNIYKNERMSSLADEWTADLEISLMPTSDRRLIFKDEILDAIEGKGRVTGEFSLTGFFAPANGGERSTVDIGAFDIVEADNFFNIRYVERGKFTNINLSSSAIISESFANEYGLSLGDTVTVTVVGREFSYTVQAIAKETGVMKRNSIVVDISSVRATLAERSPIISSLPAGIEPYTKMHVRLNDGLDASEVKTELEAMPIFSDKSFEIPGDNTKSDYLALLFTITIVIPAALLLIVAALMTVSTFDLLQKKRQNDVTLFRIIGADSRHLNKILYLESAVYGAIGGILGTALTFSLTEAINGLYNFRYSRLAFGVFDALIGIFSSLSFTALCTFIYVRKYKKNSAIDGLKHGNLNTYSGVLRKTLTFVALIATLVAVTVFLPTQNRYVTAFALLFIIILFLYVMAPYVIKALASLVSKVLSKKRRGACDLILAAKSTSNSYPLCHAGRITTVIITVFITLTYVLSVVSGQMESYVGIASFEHIGMMADEGTKEQVRDLEGVVATADAAISINVMFESGKACTGIAVSGDIDRCFVSEMLPENMPRGNEIALSKGVAKMLGVDIGDTVKCEISDIPCELILTEIVRVHGDFAYYDANYVGSGYNMFCVLTDGNSTTYDSVIATFDERGVSYLSKDEFFAYSESRVHAQIVIFNFILYIMTLMAFVGVLNVIAEQRMARRYEFDVLKQNGKTRRGIAILQTVEIGYLLVFAVAMALVFAKIAYFIIDIAAVSFGLTLYL